LSGLFNEGGKFRETVVSPCLFGSGSGRDNSTIASLPPPEASIITDKVTTSAVTRRRRNCGGGEGQLGGTTSGSPKGLVTNGKKDG